MQRRLATLLILLLAAACSGDGGSSATDSVALLQAGTNAADWLIPGKTYSGNRLTTLDANRPVQCWHLKESVGDRGQG